MRMLLMNRLMSKQRKQKRRRQIQARYGSVSSVPFEEVSFHQEAPLVTSVLFEEGSFWQVDDQSRSIETSAYSDLNLPEDIWCHIHSLMPLRDSAYSSCVSRTFLRSWRCHSKLIFTEETLGLEQKEGQKSCIARDFGFAKRVDQILKNHSGAGVKKLELLIQDRYNVSSCHLNRWLQKAITPGIEEIILLLPTKFGGGYNFPCSILLDGRGNSIRYLCLTYCALRPTVGFDCLRSLTKLHLYEVRVTGGELGCLISNSFALVDLDLKCCGELICLKIPSHLERLSSLCVYECKFLQVIESAAPNLSSFEFFGEPVQFSFVESSQLKTLTIGFYFELNTLHYAITKLPSVVPWLETLTVSSTTERVNTPMVADKFRCLKHLNIELGDDDDGAVSRSYDYLSLVSFLDACPVLESFTLNVDQDDMMHDSTFGHALHMRQIPEQDLGKLKTVQINGFCSATSMVELIFHILENATSLESLTLDTIFGAEVSVNNVRCSTRKCRRISLNMILEAHKALSVIKTYIVGRVPSTVKLNVVEPCSQCHSVDANLL